MKNYILFFLAMCVANFTFSQKQVNEMNMADSAVKAFTWDIQKEAKGTLMFLDVSYKREGQDSTEDMTLTVAKDKMHKRPAFISIIIPNSVDKARGIFVKFSRTYKDTSGKWSIEMEKSDPVRIPFEKCDDEKKICTARISGGYVVDAETDEKHDIFQKFMEYDHAYFLITYIGGAHKSVSVPLSSFKEQYKGITEDDAVIFK